jgi:amino-acid N-acetyltransferase
MRAATDTDWPAIKLLLGDCDLPLAGARGHLANFLVTTDGDEIVGCVGAEVYGDAALLRSLAVVEWARGQGLGHKLVELLIARLRTGGVRQVALLTTSAADFFTPLGFAPAARSDFPAALQQSEELKGACPESAVAMIRRL